jgi:hypothetical protein
MPLYNHSKKKAIKKVAVFGIIPLTGNVATN